jgi:hypothetical protein
MSDEETLMFPEAQSFNVVASELLSDKVCHGEIVYNELIPFWTQNLAKTSPE